MTVYEVAGKLGWSPLGPPYTLVPEGLQIGDRVELDLAPADEAALVDAGVLTRTPQAVLLRKKASTGADGVALGDSEATLLSYTFPDDQELHSAVLMVYLVVTAAQQGGKVSVNFTLGGQVASLETEPGARQPGIYPDVGTGSIALLCDPSTSVSVVQTAQMSGASRLYAELWGDR